MERTDLILKEVLKNIKPNEKELQSIKNSLKEFLEKLKKKIKVLRINAEIFVGGSFAKNTIIKKDKYDVDIFVRFDKKYKEIPKLMNKIIKGIKNISVIHGSRDYFRIKVSPTIYFELIPVLKIKNPKESENITDLSYSHVKYINKKIKSKKLLEEIMLAKAFCYANHCYGAESYINGFSGYGLEVLVYYYGSFLKFIKAVYKMKDKTIIDIEKHYRNKQMILMNMNSSKLHSPIILIDPTYKKRNALAALSEETFEKFKKKCKKFLKNPSRNAFETQKTDLKKIEDDAKKRGYEFVLIEAKTDKEPGDVAGSKLLKFYKHLDYEIEKFFQVKNKGFNYNDEKSARYFFVVKNKREILSRGPSTKDIKNVKEFEKKHKNYFIKKERIYAKKDFKVNIKNFLEGWKKKNNNKIKEMYIQELKIIQN